MGPILGAVIGHAVGKCFGPEEKEVQRANTSQAEGGGEGSGRPRCSVCGGPFEDGSGCEFCPVVAGVNA